MSSSESSCSSSSVQGFILIYLKSENQFFIILKNNKTRMIMYFSGVVIFLTVEYVKYETTTKIITI